MLFDVGFSIDISAVYIALSGLFLLLLGLDVVRGRWKYRDSTEQGRETPLARRIRVHANAAEYLPIALLLLIAVENLVPIVWLVHALGILLLVSRLIHAVGLRGMAGESFARVLGTAGTMLMISTAAILVLFHSL